MIVKKIYNRLRYELFRLEFSYSKRKRRKYNKEVNIFDIKKIFQSLNSEHQYFHHYFWNLAPNWLKNHREYFSKEKRAFGEDAFHGMWYFIFKEFKPVKVLEIGVYRGSTLSLFSLLSQKFQFQSEVHGISPFTSAGDSVSSYIDDLDYYSDVKKNFNYFNLPTPFLHEGFSTDKNMLDIIDSNSWDLIFIDGNHEYEIVKADFDVCSRNLKNGGLIVFDDSALNTFYKAPFYSTAGHFGPSKLASEIDLNIYEEILSVGHNQMGINK